MRIHRAILDRKVAEVLSRLEQGHSHFADKMPFRGPSLHFHHRALETSKGACVEAAEMVYAVLVAWGMHSMRATPQMVDFEIFERSLIKLRTDLKLLAEQPPPSVCWETLQRVFDGLSVMRGDSIVVAHSKVLSHLLPHLVAPIDRGNTLKFVVGNNSVPTKRAAQWGMFRDITQHFYYPILEADCFERSWQDRYSNVATFPGIPLD